MKKPKEQSCEGTIIRVKTRKARYGNWAHDIKLDGKNTHYSLFSNSDQFDFRMGDIVSFLFVKRHYQSGRQTAYYEIIEDSILLLGSSSNVGLAKGFVYVLGNQSMPGLLKIGYTNKTPSERAKELKTTGVPTPFDVLYSRVINGDAKLIEKAVHAQLSKYRESNTEFFKVSVDKAKTTIEEIYSKIYPLEAAADESVLSRDLKETELHRKNRLHKNKNELNEDRPGHDKHVHTSTINTDGEKPTPSINIGGNYDPHYDPHVSPTLRPGSYTLEELEEISIEDSAKEKDLFKAYSARPLIILLIIVGLFLVEHIRGLIIG